MPKKVIQTGMDEEVLENEELEQLLDAREAARAERLPYNAAFAAADKAAKAALEDAGLELGVVYRIGDFRVALEHTDAKVVSFDVAEKERFTIAPAASPE